MDAAVALQRKKTIKFLCIVDFSLSKQGIFFITLTHKTVMKKMSQSFFFVVASKIGDFVNRFLNTVLQCCPTILGRFAHLDAHFSADFWNLAGEGAIFLRKNRINPAVFFQNVFNFPAANFLLAAGIFCFSGSFQFVFRFSILYPFIYDYFAV